MSISGYGKRLKEARKYAGLTQSQMGEDLGVEWHKIKDMESERLKLSAEIAVEIEQKWSIDGWWLLTGKGEMIPSEPKNLPVAVPMSEDDPNTVSVNYYPDVCAAAGYGAINQDVPHPQIMRFDRRFLEQFLNIRRFDRIDVITVFGDSMEPFISNGETVILERIDDARNGETVIANINGDIYVKRIKKDPMKRWVKFLSDNNQYDEIELIGEDMQSVTIIGIVRAKIRPF